MLFGLAYVVLLRCSEHSETVCVGEKLPVGPSVTGRGMYELRTDTGIVPVSRAFYRQARVGRCYEVQTRGIFRRGISKMLRELPTPPLSEMRPTGRAKPIRRPPAPESAGRLPDNSSLN